MSALSARKIALLSGAAGPSLDLNFLPGILDPRITFTRAAGPATYFDSAGALQTAGTNVARFDYDPATLAPRGLLIEEARTNLLLNSATLSTQTVTVAAVANTLSFYGTGTVTLTGVSTAGPLVGTGANNRVSLTFTPTAGSLVCTVSGTVTNANLEAGAFATSYITTTGASATRAAEVATMPAAGWFNPAAISVAADVMPLAPSGAPTWISVDDGTNSNRNVLYTSSLAVHQFQALGGATSFDATSGTLTQNAVNRMGAVWSAGRQLVSVNGSAPVVTAFASLPTVTTLRIGSNPSLAQANGAFRRIRYWPRQLSASELQSATR